MDCSAPKAALYIRVSTEEQAMEGQSVDAQIETLVQYCKLYEIEIYEIYRDLGISGKSAKNRPGLQNMLKDACNGKFNMVLVWKISRLSRSLKDLLLILDQLEKHDIVFSSYSEKFDTSTPVGRMTLQLLGSIAEFERNTIIDNVKLGLKEYARKGGKTGTILGYDNIDKLLIVNQQEAELVKHIYKLYVVNRMSMNDIADYLNKQGYVTKRCKKFRKDGISVILSNPAYIGINRHNIGTNQEYQTAGIHEPIIDLETWNAAQALKQANKTKRLPHNKESVFILSNKLICKSCGHPMTGFYSKAASKSYRYYKCKSCGRLINASMIEKNVIEALLKLLLQPQITKDVLLRVNNSSKLSKKAEQLQKIQDQITTCSTQLDKYVLLYSKDELSGSPIIIDKIKLIEQKLYVLENKKANLLLEYSDIRVITEIDYHNILTENFHDKSKKVQRQIIDRAIKNIVVDKNNCQGTVLFSFSSDTVNSFDFVL